MKILDTVRSIMVPIHREGFPFIFAFFVVSVLLGLLFKPFFWIGMLLTAWCIYFFRDPDRIVPLSDKLILSPADGKISCVKKKIPPSELGLGKEEHLLISVFMNVFSCHVNRIPVDGKITKITYKSGKFLNAELDKASEENERNALIIETKIGTIGVVQVAGLIARRIRNFTTEGQHVEAGKRFGIICFGSRVDVYLPETMVSQVALGQTVLAGESILAKIKKDADELMFKTE